MDSNQNYLFGVILAGGSGSRLWPMSRELYPKHFLSLTGSQSLLQATVARIEKIVPPQNTILVTNQKNLVDIKTQLNFFERQKQNVPLEQIILEPLARNTAPAIGLVAFYLYSRNPESVMIVLPSDHLIKEKEKFLNLVRYSLELAVKGYLVTFGITPEYPETGYGYIKKRALINQKETGELEAYLAEEFLEKPDLKLSQKYLASGQYLWNSGIFVWKTKEILRAIKIFLPDLFNSLSKTSTFLSLGQTESNQNLEAIYRAIQPISIDKGVLEKSDKIAVIPAKNIGWSDVGTWDKIHQILPKDNFGNFIDKKAIQIDCENSFVYGGKRVIATLGLKDIIVVDTEDALLVCHRDKSQQVKEVFEGLKNNNVQESIQPKTVIRPWGSWSVLLEGPGYKIKKFVVNPGCSLSLQLHRQRNEHWVVVAGQAQVQREKEIFILNKNQSTFIPLGFKHRISNAGQKELEVIEIQNGDYLEEDDIVRFEDEYGRM